MSASVRPIGVGGALGWELLECVDCAYQRVRERAGRLTLRCPRCYGRMSARELQPVGADGSIDPTPILERKLAEHRYWLQWAHQRASELAQYAVDPVKCARLEERAAAYQEALDNLEWVGC